MSDQPNTPQPSGRTAEEFLSDLYNEVKEAIDYVSEIEGYEIPKVWQQYMLEPIAFAIAQSRLQEDNQPEASGKDGGK